MEISLGRASYGYGCYHDFIIIKIPLLSLRSGILFTSLLLPRTSMFVHLRAFPLHMP